MSPPSMGTMTRMTRFPLSTSYRLPRARARTSDYGSRVIRVITPRQHQGDCCAGVLRVCGRPTFSLLLGRGGAGGAIGGRRSTCPAGQDEKGQPNDDGKEA